MPHRRASIALVLLSLTGSSAQFGNLNVQWAQDEANGGSDAKPHMANDQPAQLDGLTRVSGLNGLSQTRLEEIVESFSLKCDTCTTTGHWISRVRSGILEMHVRQLKAQLNKRGVKCEKCVQREHYIDKLLDSAHLPQVNS